MRRPRAPGAGNTRELRVMDTLAAWGWLCGSRRHIGGPGDILATRWLVESADGTDPLGDADLILVEVKSTAGGPYERFVPEARIALRLAADEAHAEAWLAWWPARKPLQWLHSSAWPHPRPQPESRAPRTAA